MFGVILLVVSIFCLNSTLCKTIFDGGKSTAPDSSSPYVSVQPVPSPASPEATSTLRPIPTTSASPSAHLKEPASQGRGGWETYRDEKYKFEIRYPGEGWLLTSKAGEPILPYATLREPINLYTARSVPAQGPISAPITVAVYEKPFAITLMQWLSEGYNTDLAKVQIGAITTALTEASAGKTGTLSYNEHRKNGADIYEVGSAWSNGYALTYATFFTKDDLPYIYEISFLLPYYGSILNVKPSDSEYINTYTQIISSFKFNE